ncbi:Deoxycytidylate deaminase [Aphelenchoides bicaudatus]|nr:Deoxycytidylate deaminase [Aphelenchoides bicaudatus]
MDPNALNVETAGKLEIDSASAQNVGETSTSLLTTEIVAYSGVSQSDSAQASSSDASSIQGKRENYLGWAEYFMSVALLAAHRSKDPCTRVGAVIADTESNIIQGIGYNGFPRGCSDDDLPWAKGMPNPLDNKYFYVCHAEMNAILNRNSASGKNSIIYVTLFPCNECCKMIIQSGIQKVVYMEDKPNKVEMQASRRMFELAGVELSKFTTNRAEIVIKF